MKEYVVPSEALDLSRWSHVSGLPRTITTQIVEACRQLSPDAPTYVPCLPAPYCKRGRCYPNVQRTIEEYGGEAVYGWSLWELPGIWLYAEHHCVWRKPGGELVCVTPQLEGEIRILFLAGAKPEEVGSSQYLPYERHPLVMKAIEHQEKRNALIEEGQYETATCKYHDEQVCRLLQEFQKRAAKRAAWAKEKKEKAKKKKKRR